MVVKEYFAMTTFLGSVFYQNGESEEIIVYKMVKVKELMKFYDIIEYP